MLIATQISSYLVPRAIWLSGYANITPLALPARDALNIERRWRKGVELQNEARRYTVCCDRMQSLVRELALADAPMPPPHVWPTFESRTVEAPGALAYMAMFEYLRRSYTFAKPGQDKRERLRHYRVEATFHPPDKRARDFLALLAHIGSEPKLLEMCGAASRKADVAHLGFSVSAQECETAFQERLRLVTKCVEEDLGLVDVFEIV